MGVTPDKAQEVADARVQGRSWLGFDYYAFNDFRDDLLRHKANSVEAGIAVLPAEFLNNFTLMRQGAALQSSRPEFPRAVLFGETGHLVVTFNGHADQSGFGSLETAEFDEASRRIFYRSIVFKAVDQDGHERKAIGDDEVEFQNEQILVTKANPRVCMSCHAQFQASTKPVGPVLARYLWHSYPTWPSAYGAQEDGIPVGEELERFVARKSEWAKHPRYRELFRQPAQRDGAYPFQEAKGKGTVHSAARMPNTRLSVNLAAHYARQMTDVLRANPAFVEAYRAKLARNCARPLTPAFVIENSIDGNLRRFGFDSENITIEPNGKGRYFSGYSFLGNMIYDLLDPELRGQSGAVRTFVDASVQYLKQGLGDDNPGYLSGIAERQLKLFALGAWQDSYAYQVPAETSLAASFVDFQCRPYR
jgi:hypothetical protein